MPFSPEQLAKLKAIQKAQREATAAPAMDKVGGLFSGLFGSQPAPAPSSIPAPESSPEPKAVQFSQGFNAALGDEEAAADKARKLEALRKLSGR